MNLNFFYDLAEICVQKNLRNIILSPGSRVAPLTMAFSRHADICTYTMSDERAAAFTAMGMAQLFVKQYMQHKRENLDLVGIACTSGSAAYNYAPAIAEAFYQEIPLLVFTADRPPEWVDQLDGQTIRQKNIYGNHIKKSFEIPVDRNHPDAFWHAIRLVNEAINLAQALPYGPVHINVPIREPFYPKPEEQHYMPAPKIIEVLKATATLDKILWNTLVDQWEGKTKILIVVGQYDMHPDLLKSLSLLYQDYRIPIIGDTISNIQGVKGAIRYHDTFLMNQSIDFLESLRPDLLITFGKSLISKALKLFLRNFPARDHWHIQEAGSTADTFQSLKKIIPISPEIFFGQLYSDLDFMNMLDKDEEGEDNPFDQTWQKANAEAAQYLHQFDFDSNKLTDFQAVYHVLQKIPQHSILHLANSMSVRYANYVALQEGKYTEIFANRGTSGIDGSTSTALGTALASGEQIVTLITGDLAFFYDRNALWNNFTPENFRIILLNNHSGNIFRMINGPSDQPEFEEYFETFQNLEAANTAQDFDLNYYQVNRIDDLKETLNDFFEPSEKASILEIITDKVENAVVWKKYKKNYLQMHS